MRSATLMTILAAPLVLAACDGGREADEAENIPMAGSMPMAEDMPMMQPGGAGQTASGEGTVTAIDTEAGTITIDHGPVPAVDWPAMTMAFQADEALRGQVAVGDDVAFEFQIDDAGSRITAIDKK